MDLIDAILSKFQRMQMQLAELESISSPPYFYRLYRLNEKDRRTRKYLLSVSPTDAQGMRTAQASQEFDVTNKDVADAIRAGGCATAHLLAKLGHPEHALAASAVWPRGQAHQILIESMSTSMPTYVVYDDGVPEPGITILKAGYYLRIRSSAAGVDLTFELPVPAVADAVENGTPLIRLGLELHPQAVRAIVENDAELLAAYEQQVLAMQSATAIPQPKGKTRSI